MTLQYPDDGRRARPTTAARALRAREAIGFDLGDGPFTNPKYPQPSTLDDQRLLRRQRLAIALRVFARHGFDDGAAGHVTVRDPELTDHFWVNPVGCPWSLTRVRDLLLVDPEGQVVEGSGRVNLAAFTLHSHIHAARPDVVAAAHAHTAAGRAFSSLHQPLAPLNQDACAFYGDHILDVGYAGVVNTDDEGARVAAALGPCKAAVLANHGLLTVGHTVDSAAWWLVSLERCARAQLEAQAAGTPVPIPHDTALATRAQVGDERWGRFSFHPLALQVVATQPDVLD